MEKMITLDHQQVMEIIPHREPMLLIDEVSELIPGKYIRASLWIDPQRDIFRGHFPENPVFPGVYTIEASAQAVDLLLMTKAEYAGKVPLFLGIDEAKFRKMVLPGDTLEICAELVRERAEKAIATCGCKAYVKGELAAEANITIAMR